MPSHNDDLNAPRRETSAGWVDRVIGRAASAVRYRRSVEAAAVGAGRFTTSDSADAVRLPRPADASIDASLGLSLSEGSLSEGPTAHGLGDLTEEPQGWQHLYWSEQAEQSRSHRGSSPAALSWLTSFLKEWVPVILIGILIAYLSRAFLVQAYHIPSESMMPTLTSGDRVVVNRLSYSFGETSRGEVVVFARTGQSDPAVTDLIKRVVGLPGETIQFRDGEVFIESQRLQEPYLLLQNSTRPKSQAIPGCTQEKPSAELCEIPQGHVFVMGDNRTDSLDSRVFGPIDVDSIVGRAFVQVWPWDGVGWL